MGIPWQSGETRSVPDVLRERVLAGPDSAYLEFDRRMFSASEIEAQSLSVAAGLLGLGVKPGDRVASLLNNGVEAVLTWFGTMMAGAIAVPVNTALKGDFLRHQLADSGASVLVVQSDLLARVKDVAERLPALRRCVVVGPAPEGPGVASSRWDELCSEARLDQALNLESRTPATILYTGGTTGPSKGCIVSHAYMVGRSARTQWVLQRTARDILWTPLPLFHVNAYQFGVLGAALTGGSSCFAPRFSVSNFWPEVKRTGATIASLLGSLATLIARAPDHADSAGHRLRMVLAVPTPPELDQLWQERFGVRVFSGMYGQTEASPLSITPPGTENKPGAAGRVNDFEFEVRIFDDQDRELPADTVGEIVCRPKKTHVMFEGYWQRPDATAAAYRNLWYHTGDFGKLDNEGYLYFADRKQDYLRRRGENISSYEVESYLMTHGALEDVAAHAVPSEFGEDEVKITAVLKAGVKLTEEELCRFCADGLPYFAVPRFVEFRQDLPRNPVGRVLKVELRGQGVTPATWDREKAGFKMERR